MTPLLTFILKQKKKNNKRQRMPFWKLKRERDGAAEPSLFIAVGVALLNSRLVTPKEMLNSNNSNLPHVHTQR